MNKLLVFFIFITFILSGCANVKNVKMESCKVFNNNGAIIEEWSYLYDTEGRIINDKRCGFDEKYYWNRFTVYNTDGSVKEITDYQNDVEIYRITKFDYVSGKCIKERTYDRNNTLLYYSLIEYPYVNSQVISSYNNGNQLTERCVNIMDKEKRVIQTRFYNTSGKKTGLRKLKYTGDNREPSSVSQTYSRENHYVIYTYDEHGEKITHYEYENGILQKNWKYELTYNSDRNLIKENFYEKNKFTGSKHFIYRDDNEKLMKFFILYDAENKILERGEFKYVFYN